MGRAKLYLQLGDLNLAEKMTYAVENNLLCKGKPTMQAIINKLLYAM
jgi:hypothetical protein